MNFNDLLGAIEDMFGYHGASLTDVIYIQQSNGEYKSVDGFDFKDGKVIIE